MKWLVILLMIAGCASIEERCHETNPGDFNGWQKCVSQGYQEQQEFSQAMIQGSQAIKNVNQPTQSGSSTGFVDQSCMNRCSAQGSMLDYCRSKCSY